MTSHLAQCSSCRQELAGLERISQLLGSVPAPPPPSELVAATLQRARLALEPTARRRPAMPVWLSAAGAAAAVLVVAFRFWSGPAAPPSPAVVTVIAPAEPGRPLFASARPAARPTPETAPVIVATVALSATPARRVPRPTVASRATARPVATDPSRAKTVVPAPEAAAARALENARRHGASDPDLAVAALENVAAAYPNTSHAGQALLAVAELQEERGHVQEAEVAYRKVLSLPGKPPLPQALAHKALGDMRRESSGEDDVVRFHYAEASRALRVESARTPAAGRVVALVALADIESSVGQRNQAVADLVAASIASRTGGDEAGRSLADIL